MDGSQNSTNNPSISTYDMPGSSNMKTSTDNLQQSSMPMYYQQNEIQPPYDYMGSALGETYDPRYPWRDFSNDKGFAPQRYEQDSYAPHKSLNPSDTYPSTKSINPSYVDSYQPTHSNSPGVQMNIVQRISSLIKSQLPLLQASMMMIPRR
eukprot:GHVR01014057.1.p1 GENE.GHVR01014057.1~~GHVR01014057.1.p1  ORF type:complete len:151 (+),score=15.07 GHVR01014057.1:6371-6823(+)